MTGAEVIADSFVRHGIERVYVFPGGTIAPILDLLEARSIGIFCSRHEQGAGYAALAHARLTGKPQIVMVTSGPGATNLVTPVADAYFDSTPMVVLTGQVGTGDLRGDRPVRQRGFQEVDSAGIMRPITKAQLTPMSPDDLPEMMARAFEVAVSGRPGPVLVDLPMNVQRGELKEPPKKHVRDEHAPLEAPDAQIGQLVDWLLSAKQPVILAGQGVLLAHAHEELRRLAELGQIPVSQSLMGLGSFPTASPLALGFHGHTGNQTAGRAIHNADLLIVVGSRLDVRQTGSRVEAFVPHGRVVRIDSDPAELDHSRVRNDLRIFADARLALRKLVARLEGHALPDWSAWRAQVDAWRREFPLAWADGEVLKPQHVVHEMNRVTADHPVICVSGVGSHQQWVARHFDFDFPRRPWLTSGGHGAMGYDLPSAVGAQLARPDMPVVCLVGDGSLQINIQELAAVVEYKLPLKIVVIDNHRLGIVSQFQNLNWKRDPTCGEKWNPDFAQIARAYGIESASVTHPRDLSAALKRAWEHKGAFLVHCVVDPVEDVSPMLLAGQTMDQMWPHG